MRPHDWPPEAPVSSVLFRRFNAGHRTKRFDVLIRRMQLTARGYRSSARQALCAIPATEDIFAIGVDQTAFVITQRRLRQSSVSFDPESKCQASALRVAW